MYSRYKDLELSEKKLYQHMVRDLAIRMLSTLSDENRLSLDVDELVIYDLSMTAFEETFSVLKNVGLIDPVYPERIFDGRQKLGTPYGRLKSNIEEIPAWFENQTETGAFMEEVLDAYVHLIIDHDGKLGGGKRFWYHADNSFEAILELFEASKYLEKSDEYFCWTERMAFSMWRNGCWQYSNDTELETLLLTPLISKLTTDIPDYVEHTIERAISSAKDADKQKNHYRIAGSINFEKVINTHYRFEKWMPREEASKHEVPNYWNGITARLSEALVKKYRYQ